MSVATAVGKTPCARLGLNKMAALQVYAKRFVTQTWLLLIAALIFEVIAIAALQQQPQWMPALRVVHLLQMAVVLLMAVHAMRNLTAAQSVWAWQAKGLVLALVFAITGDIINSGLIDFSHITEKRHLLSIPAFALMQGIYVLLFWRSAATNPSDRERLKPIKLLGLILWLPLSLLLWFAVFTNDIPVLMERATLFYVCLVVLMGISSCWISYIWGKAGFWVTVGALSFMVSDALIGIALNKGGVPAGMATHWVWITYIGAQCLIVRLPLLGHIRESAAAQ